MIDDGFSKEKYLDDLYFGYNDVELIFEQFDLNSGQV